MENLGFKVSNLYGKMFEIDYFAVTGFEPDGENGEHTLIYFNDRAVNNPSRLLAAISFGKFQEWYTEQTELLEQLKSATAKTLKGIEVKFADYFKNESIYEYLQIHWLVPVRVGFIKDKNSLPEIKHEVEQQFHIWQD